MYLELRENIYCVASTEPISVKITPVESWLNRKKSIFSPHTYVSLIVLVKEVAPVSHRKFVKGGVVWSEDCKRTVTWMWKGNKQRKQHTPQNNKKKNQKLKQTKNNNNNKKTKQKTKLLFLSIRLQRLTHKSYTEFHSQRNSSFNF